jgi:hypothetical protein
MTSAGSVGSPKKRWSSSSDLAEEAEELRGAIEQRDFWRWHAKARIALIDGKSMEQVGGGQAMRRTVEWLSSEENGHPAAYGWMTESCYRSAVCR